MSRSRSRARKRDVKLRERVEEARQTRDGLARLLGKLASSGRQVWDIARVVRGENDEGITFDPEELMMIAEIAAPDLVPKTLGSVIDRRSLGKWEEETDDGSTL